LLIDDDYISNFIADHLLNKHKICKNITISRNGDEALNYLQETKAVPELIFLDINMPVLDGIEFIETFQKYNRDESKTKIVIYTTSLNHQDLELFKLAGFKYFTVKPLREETLMSLLKLFDNN